MQLPAAVASLLPAAALPPLPPMVSGLAVLLGLYYWWRWALCELNVRKVDDPLPSNELRRVGKLPDPPYPSGWFRLCFSSELPTGQPRTFPAFGALLLAFRDESGQVRSPAPARAV